MHEALGAHAHPGPCVPSCMHGNLQMAGVLLSPNPRMERCNWVLDVRNWRCAHARIEEDMITAGVSGCLVGEAEGGIGNGGGRG